MKEKFVDHNLRGDSANLVSTCEDILDDFRHQGYTLTLRQLYYQLVSKDIIPNNERSYKNLGTLITKAREAGLIDWNDIEDRNRSCNTHYFEEDETTILKGLDRFITYDQWSRQGYYIEVWVEKDALINVISRPCERLQLPYMACKGYLSVSEAYRAGKRFEEAVENGKAPVLIHLGDHDPSGLDMTRDNRDRLSLFSGHRIHVERIALNRDQIDRYNPPPNPAKLTDPRAVDYIRDNGNTSWELDALQPKIIDDLISRTVEKYIDRDIWEQTENEQAAIREKIKLLPELHDDIFELVEKRFNKKRRK